MQNEKRMMTPLAYYLILASIVNSIFILISAAIFVLVPPPIELNEITIIFLLIFLLLKGPIAGFVTAWAKKRNKFQKLSGSEFVGLYFGRFYGVIVGFFLGAEIARGIGAIVGALSFYFIGYWVGSRTGLYVGRRINADLSDSDAMVNNQNVANR